MNELEHDELEPDHDALTCPQCQSFTEAAKIMGGFGEALDRMIQDGTFERMGREMAMAREKAFWDAFLK